MFCPQLTNSDNRGWRRGETGCGRRVAVSIDAPSRNRETNRETENARNVGQMGSCGSAYAVNKLRGNRREEGNWLPEGHANTNSRMENSLGREFSSLLTTRGNSEMRPSRMDVSPGDSIAEWLPGTSRVSLRPIDVQASAPLRFRRRARPSLRRTSAEVEAGRRSCAAAGAALRTFPGMAYRLPFNVRRHIMEK
jgi:hypothetical protein